MDVKELISRIEYNNGNFPEKKIKQLIDNKEAYYSRAFIYNGIYKRP